MQEIHDARPILVVAYNSRLPILGDLQEVLHICLAYKSAKRPPAEGLIQQNDLATGREFLLQRLHFPSVYESALQELEGLTAQLSSSEEEGAAGCATSTSTTIKVLTQHPSFT